MLFHTKIAELRQYLLSLSNELAVCQLQAYPNLVRRTTLLLDEVAQLGEKLNQIDLDLAHYSKPVEPRLDTWPQIFSALREIAQGIHLLRTLELPAMLATAPEDAAIADILSALHHELGIGHVAPCVTLRQTRWFAVRPLPSDVPLYFLPASILANPHELALIFHEVGHVTYRSWNASVATCAQRAFIQTWTRKMQFARTLPDPSERADFQRILQEWHRSTLRALEEVVCDIVGTLLGGPAFVLALTLGMLGDAHQPFTALVDGYPPLDSRVRISLAVLHSQGWTDAFLLTPLVEGWNTIRTSTQQNRVRWYDFLYDDDYFQPLVDAVAQELCARGMVLYDPQSHGLRAQLTQGSRALLQSEDAYIQWAEIFRSQFSPTSEALTNHSSGSPSSSSSSQSPSSSSVTASRA